MTGVRQSVIYALEDDFCKGKPSGDAWIAPPPGSYVSFTMNRDVTSIRQQGSKFIHAYSWGRVYGSFSWKFYLDYEYVEWLRLVFEDYSCTDNGDGTYTHSFSKANNARIPSFCFRVATLDRMVGGEEDEVTEFRGCFATSAKFSCSAGASYVQVDMSGVVSDAESIVGDLTTTDYQEYDGDLVEFQCLFAGDEMSSDTYVSYIDSVTLSVENSAEGLNVVCSPYFVNYYEGNANFSLSLSAYSNSIDRFRRMFYSGGQSLDEMPLYPMCKNMGPCDSLYIASYDLCRRDGTVDGTDMSDAIEQSSKSFAFHVEDAVYKVAQWPSGDGSKLQEQISSAECRKVSLEVRTTIPDLRTRNSHPVTAVTPS